MWQQKYPLDFYKAFILLETSNLTEKEIKEELDLKFPFFKSRSDYNTMFEYWKAKYCPYLLTKEQQEHYVQICTEHIKSGLKLSDFSETKFLFYKRLLQGTSILFLST